MDPAKGWLQTLFLGDLGQQLQLHELQNEITELRAALDRPTWGERQTRELAQRVLESHLRLGILVRLLIAKGVIQAEEFAALIAASRPKPVEHPASQNDDVPESN